MIKNAILLDAFGCFSFFYVSLNFCLELLKNFLLKLKTCQFMNGALNRSKRIVSNKIQSVFIGTLFFILIIEVLNLYPLLFDMSGILLYSGIEKNKIRIAPKFVTNHVVKRTMMAAETILTIAEKKGAVAVLSTHFHFLAKPNTTSRDFLINMAKCVSLDVKNAQHFFKIFYPGLGFSSELVREIFPRVKFYNDDLFWDIDYVVATIGGSQISCIPPFNKSTITVLSSPKYIPGKKYPTNTLEFEQTKQNHPDFQIDHPNVSRFNDLKAYSGPLSPNKGSLKLISDPQDYEDKSRELFLAQKEAFKALYPGSLLIKQMKNYQIDISAKKETWTSAYDSYKCYLIANLHNYPKLNPFFIFLTKEQSFSSKKIDGIITTKSFSSIDSTIESVGRIFSHSKPQVFENYKRFNPLGFGEKNSLISKIKDFISNGID